MTEAQQKSLKILHREIDSLGPRQRYFDRELEAINLEMESAYAVIIERRVPLRTSLPKFEAAKQRLARYQVGFAKVGRKIEGLRARLDAINQTDLPAEEIKLLSDKFIAVLDGSHRTKATILIEKETTE